MDMHITLPGSTLLDILIVIIVFGFLWGFVIGPLTHRSGRTRTLAPRRLLAPRPAQERARKTPKRGRLLGWLPEGGRIPARTRDPGEAVARMYGRSRSPEWPALAHAHLQKEPACVACGYRGKGLQVHHIKPFHLFPELELDPNNLITLCEVKGRDHHLLLGHLDDWESYNLNVRTDVKRFHNESAQQIKAEPAWQEEVMKRPMP
jgi:5-methylcytosine-specific restriction endonuclease McrA